MRAKDIEVGGWYLLTHRRIAKVTMHKHTAPSVAALFAHVYGEPGVQRLHRRQFLRRLS